MFPLLLTWFKFILQYINTTEFQNANKKILYTFRPAGAATIKIKDEMFL